MNYQGNHEGPGCFILRKYSVSPTSYYFIYLLVNVCDVTLLCIIAMPMATWNAG